jgi:hypoxanthine phosphoribosyltransferase
MTLSAILPAMLEIPSYFEKLLTADEVAARVRELGAQLSADYDGRKPHFVAVLRGANTFLADLVRAMDIELTYDFIAVASYAGTESSGQVRLVKDLDESVESRHVIVIEDILDSGLTCNYIREMLMQRKVASLALCALLDRPHRRELKMDLDYVGFQIPDKFVVGYGLDFEQRWRQLPDIWAIN